MTTASSTVTNQVTTFQEILRPKAISKALGLALPTTYALLANGTIPTVKLSDKAVGAYAKDVESYLAKLNPSNPATPTTTTENPNLSVGGGNV